jgi:hypothetical protein
VDHCLDANLLPRWSLFIHPYLLAATYLCGVLEQNLSDISANSITAFRLALLIGHWVGFSRMLFCQPPSIRATLLKLSPTFALSSLRNSLSFGQSTKTWARVACRIGFRFSCTQAFCALTFASAPLCILSSPYWQRIKVIDPSCQRWVHASDSARVEEAQ